MLRRNPLSSRGVGLLFSLVFSLLLFGSLPSATIVDDLSSIPVSAARVRVLNEAGNDLANEESNSTGWFQLPDRSPFQLRISKPGFLPLLAGAGVLNSDATDHESSTAIRLIRYGSISGQVRDSEGNAVTAARVVALRKSRWIELWEPVGVPSEVDRDGNYRLYNLTPDLYRLSVLNVALNGHDLKGILVTGREFLILGGEAYDGTVIQLAAEDGFRVKGRIQGNDDLPALVSLLPDEEPGVPVASTLAQPGKEFEFMNVLPGQYRLVARSGQSKQKALFGRTKIQVASSNVEGVEIPLKAGNILSLTLSGMATSRLQVGCTDSLSVSLLPVESLRLPRQNASGRVSSNGQVSFGPLEPGTYLVMSSSPDGCESTSPRYVDLPSDQAYSNLEMNAPLLAGSIRVHLSESTYSRDSFVILLPFGCGGNDCLVRLGKPNDGGVVVFGRLPTGNYYVMARRSTDFNTRWRPATNDSGPVMVEPGVCREVEISNVGNSQ